MPFRMPVLRRYFRSHRYTDRFDVWLNPESGMLFSFRTQGNNHNSNRVSAHLSASTVSASMLNSVPCWRILVSTSITAARV